MKLAGSWKGRLVATFVFGVARVVAFIGVGVLGALVVLALKNGEPYGGLLLALAVVAPLSGILHWLESWIAHDMAFRLLAEMRVSAFRKLDQLAPAYLVRRRTGDLMALATHDIELVEYFFAHTIAPAFVAVLIPAVVLGVLVAQSPWLALALLPFLAIVGVSPLLLRKRIDRLGSTAREAAGELGAYAVDSAQGLGEIVAFQHEQERGAGLDALSARHIALRLPFFRQLTMQQSLLEVLTGFGGLAVVMVGAALTTAGEIDPGVLPLLTLLAMAAFLPVSEIAQIGRQLADTLGATRRIHALNSEPVVVTDGPGAPASDGPVGPAFAVARSGRVRLSRAEPRCPGRRRHRDRCWSGGGPGWHLRSGQDDDGAAVDAVLGPRPGTGHPRRHRPPRPPAGRRGRPDRPGGSGHLPVQRHAAGQHHDRSPVGLRRRAGLCHHPRLARRAGRWPARRGPTPWSASEAPASLAGSASGFAIARAFLKDAPVLLLDEATSHLDAVNEATLRRSLDQLQADRTTVVIAHRLSTVRHADVIVVLDDGHVVETGDHSSLLAADGLYATLVSRQLAASTAR